MATISLRVSAEDDKLIREYASVNNLNLSDFIRQTILNKIEDDFKLDEERILAARKKAEKEKKYDHTEVWDILEFNHMYRVEFSESAVKQLKKMDKQTARVIKNWVIKNLVNTDDPKQHGKALVGNLKGIWKYRVGDYRLFADIEDDVLLIFIFEIGHRREVYK